MREASLSWTECVPPNSYIEALIVNVTVFDNGDFREVIRLNEVVKVGP